MRLSRQGTQAILWALAFLIAFIAESSAQQSRLWKVVGDWTIVVDGNLCSALAEYSDNTSKDELGYHVVENKVTVRDLQATIMHLLGFDHEKLTYEFAGRPFRLTDVHGEVVKAVLA